MTMWKLALRNLRSRPARSALTLLSVAIGVAAVLSVAMVRESTRRSYLATQDAVAGRAALEVVGDGERPIDAGLTSILAKMPGVAAALPLVDRPSVLYFNGKRVKVFVLGIDWPRPELAQDYQLTQGTFQLGGQAGLLTGDFAAGLGIRCGEQVRILTRSGVATVQVSGFLSRRSAGALSRPAVLVLALADAQRLLGNSGRVDKIQLMLEPSIVAENAAVEIARRLPDDAIVRVPPGREALATESLAAVDRGLSFTGTLSLVLAAAVILNTLLMNVSERRAQLGMLRSLGATRRQVVRLILREALLLGLAGSALGCSAGVVGAQLLLRAMERLLDTTLPPSQLTLGPYLLAVTLGLATTLLAAYLPARAASRVAPIEAMAGAAREAAAGGESRFAAVTAAGAALLAMVAAIVPAALRGWLHVWIVTPMEVVALVGCALLIPLLLKPLATVMKWLLLPLPRAEARLAHLQIVRRPTRAALTIGTLFVAMAFSVSIGGTTLNALADVRTWTRRAVMGDFYVWATLPEVATVAAVSLPETLRGEIMQLAGVESVDTLRYAPAKVDEQSVIVIAREFSAQRYFPLDLRDGDPREVQAGLFQGAAVIGTALGHRLNLAPGDDLPLQTSAGPRAMRIAGIANDYTVGGMTVYLHRPVAERLLQVEGVDGFVVDSRPGETGRTHAALKAFCEQRGLLFQPVGELHALMEHMMSGLLAGLWALVVLAFAVAALSVCNTLMMDVLERTREISLLRVVGMTRRQVRTMVLAQTLIMAGIGLLPGAAVGVLLSWLNNLSAIPLLGHPIGVEVHPVWLMASVAAALAITLAAAWLPAQRAARLELIVGLQCE